MTTGPVLSEPAAEAAIGAACQALHLPTVAAQAVELADQAARDRLTHRAYLAELLSAETDTRDARRRDRRVKEAKFPRVKRLADFDLSAAPGVAPATLATLASGTWIDHGTPLVLLGDSGTGKSHLLIGVGVAACEQGRTVRYVTCAALVNELVEAADERTLAKTIGRYARLDLLCCDELGYLHLDPRGAELLFQVITEREERASIAVASNAPFSEWGQTFTDPRLAAAVVDRLTSTPTSSRPAPSPTGSAPPPPARREPPPTDHNSIRRPAPAARAPTPPPATPPKEPPNPDPPSTRADLLTTQCGWEIAPTRPRWGQIKPSQWGHF
jgi:DNA replication protein DnaC